MTRREFFRVAALSTLAFFFFWLLSGAASAAVAARQLGKSATQLAFTKIKSVRFTPGAMPGYHQDIRKVMTRGWGPPNRGGDGFGRRF